MSRESDLKNKAIAINYSWDSESHLLRAGVDNEQNLIILQYLSYPAQTLSSVLAAYTKEYKNYTIFTNVFKPLKVEIGGRCRQFELEKVAGLEIFYENLIVSKRFQVVGDIHLPSDNNFILCVSFLLNGLMSALCGKSEGGWIPPRPDDEDIENFGQCQRKDEYPWQIFDREVKQYSVDCYEAYMLRGSYKKLKEEKIDSGRFTAIWTRGESIYKAYYSDNRETFSYHEKIAPTDL